ncbi:MAG: calcium-translocating P-type ATPase, PMCA-type [Actinobacteria bacterium]|nr:calcium-translocating P-type ATPase, PMCA-type [Actinomycetota bacterium]
MRPWHALTENKVLEILESNLKGLTNEEAQKRLEKYGLNEIATEKKKTFLRMILDQIINPLVIVLIAASIVTIFLKEFTDALIILIIVLLNTAIGFYQEYKAERAMEELRSYAPQTAKVIRDGSLKVIDATQLVPGDIVVLDVGDIIPADLRLLKANSMKIDESLLTGESVPVEKIAEEVLHENSSVPERRNMAFKGTPVVNGDGIGIVVATGTQTEIGKISHLLSSTEEEKTPLQKRLEDFSKKLTVIVIFIVAFLFAIGTLRGGNIYEIFLTSVSLAVAAVPEALPAVVTIILSLGASLMAKNNALIRHLPSVETLGCTDFICTDKTGTLTLNQMSVVGYSTGSLKEVIDKFPEGKIGDLIKLTIINNHDCRVLESGKVIGDPTEIALLKSAYRSESIHTINNENIFCKFPFDSKRKMMSVGVKSNGQNLLLVKGSPEALIANSSKYLDDEGNELYIDNVRETLLNRVEDFAIKGFRTIGFAYKQMSAIDDVDERDLTFLGLALLIDPPRPEVKDAIKECYSAGIKVVMITGDHPQTAKKIAEEIGIQPVKRVITGKELYELPMSDFEEIVEGVFVYARVDPEQKLKIVDALKDKNHVVAMTGDGVNDAPALKKADIGIAMGVTGTEVAKEVSDMILLDDNFATIVKAVREGRRLYENIRKFIKYTMGSNTGEIVSIILAPLIGLPIPLKPVHILWINLVTDGLPGLAMAFEKEEPDVMEKPPRPLNQSIFAENLGWHIIWVGFLLGIITLAAFQLSHIFGWHKEATTIAFSVLCLAQLGHAFAIRSHKYSTFSLGFFSNRMLTISVALTFILQMALIYVPFLNIAFKTVPLSLPQLALILLFSTFIFIAVEIEKLLIRKYDIYEKIKSSLKNNGL